MKLISLWSKLALALIVANLPFPVLTQAQTPGEIARNTFPSVVLLVLEGTSGISQASGFFVSDNVVATNFHVIEHAARGYAKIVGGEDKYAIEGYVAIDEEMDVALLKIAAVGALYLSLGDDSQVEVGDKVYAVGNPRGIEGALSEGIVNSVQQKGNDRVFLLQAPISPGSSGGPVLNIKGEVIGIAVGFLEGGQNLNIAVPVSYLRPLMANMQPAKPLPGIPPPSPEPIVPAPDVPVTEPSLLWLVLTSLVIVSALVLILSRRKRSARMRDSVITPLLSGMPPSPPPEYAIDDPGTCQVGQDQAGVSSNVEVKPGGQREWWLAALLSILVPGLGQLYNGQAKKGLLFYCLLWVFAAASLLISSLHIDLLILVFLIMILVNLAKLFIHTDAIITARRHGGSYQLKSYNKWYLYLVAVAISWFVVLPVWRDTISNFTEAKKIPSGTMLPTLQIGDCIYIHKVAYRSRPPDRGDIIVFQFPQDETRDFIKRVIALPGEKVEIRGKQVYLNDKPLREPYAVHLDRAIQESPLSPRDSFGPVLVPPGQLFMMGDNRDYSMDSRFWGFLDMKKVKGKASIIYWSWDRDRFRPRLGRIGMVIR